MKDVAIFHPCLALVLLTVIRSPGWSRSDH